MNKVCMISVNNVSSKNKGQEYPKGVELDFKNCFELEMVESTCCIRL